MFDIGFTELLLLSIMALLVLGPERLPVAVKTIALWSGRFKRSWNKLRNDIEKEIGADEIRQQLHNEQILRDLGEDTRKLQDNFQQGFQSIEHDLKDIENSQQQNKTPDAASENDVSLHNSASDAKIYENNTPDNTTHNNSDKKKGEPS